MQMQSPHGDIPEKGITYQEVRVRREQALIERPVDNGINISGKQGFGFGAGVLHGASRLAIRWLGRPAGFRKQVPGKFNELKTLILYELPDTRDSEIGNRVAMRAPFPAPGSCSPGNSCT